MTLKLKLGRVKACMMRQVAPIGKIRHDQSSNSLEETSFFELLSQPLSQVYRCDKVSFVSKLLTFIIRARKSKSVLLPENQES